VWNYKLHRIVENGEPESFREFVARNEIEQLRQWSTIPDWTAPPPKAAKVEKESV
jgi:hypothetical protein